MDLGKVDLLNEAQGPWACRMRDVMAEEIPQVLPQVLPGAVRKGRPPRPRYPGGEIGHAAEAARPNRSVCALFDRPRFENYGVPCRGCQSTAPLSPPRPRPGRAQFPTLRVLTTSAAFQGEMR